MRGRMLRALAVSYADRLAAFVMPLLILRSAGGEEAYVKVEYVIAISIVVATFADAGLRNYVLYHFGRNRDATQTTFLTSRAAVFVFAFQIVLLAGTIMASHALLLPDTAATGLWLGVLRGIALSIVGVATQIFIIHDRPLLGILLSLSFWVIGAIALVLPDGTPANIRVMVFFASAFLTLFAVPLLLCRTTGLKPTSVGFAYLQSATGWAWPLLLAAGTSMAAASIVRVYGITAYSATVAAGLVFWMRIFSLIQLSHRAAVTIVSRSIFSSDDSDVLSPQVLRTYMLLVIPSIALAFIVGFAAPVLNTLFEWHLPLLSPLVITMVGLQVTFWTLSSLLEMPLNRQGNVFSVLFASAASAVLFIGTFLTLHDPTPLILTSTMALASMVQFAILLLRNFSR